MSDVKVITPTVGRVVLFVPKKDSYDFGYCILAGKPPAG